MNKKRFFLISGALLVVLLVAGVLGVAVVSAQEPPPPAEDEVEAGALPILFMGRGRGHGGRGLMGGLMGGRDWTSFDTVAEALGLTPEELFSELHSGKTLEEVAEAQGVDMDAVQEALNAGREEAMRARIEQAVEDGTLTQEQADWMLEGLDQGFMPMGGGFGRGGFGHGRGPGCPAASTSGDE